MASEVTAAEVITMVERSTVAEAEVGEAVAESGMPAIIDVGMTTVVASFSIWPITHRLWAGDRNVIFFIDLTRFWTDKFWLCFDLGLGF